MDFRFTPEQDEAAELAANILRDRATNDRLKSVEAGGDRFDRDLWGALGNAGLLGLALPEAYDGAGLGLPLARRLARAAGGDVHALPGDGGRFRVELPTG